MLQKSKGCRYLSQLRWLAAGFPQHQDDIVSPNLTNHGALLAGVYQQGFTGFGEEQFVGKSAGGFAGGNQDDGRVRHQWLQGSNLGAAGRSQIFPLGALIRGPFAGSGSPVADRPRGASGQVSGRSTAHATLQAHSAWC